MAITRSARQYLGVRAIHPPDLILATRNPTTTDLAYVKGTLWLNTVATTVFMFPGVAPWVPLGGGAISGIISINTIDPTTAGNFTINGTTSQLTVTAGTNAITLSLPAVITAPGSLTTTTTLASGTTFTAGTGITATTGNIVATAGNITTTAGSITSATSLTATLGNITATNGNLSLATAGNKIIIATGANASVGTSGTMSGTPGAVTVATTASSATALIHFSRKTTGGTPGQVSITAQDGTGFTLTSTGNETSTFNWWIINA